MNERQFVERDGLLLAAVDRAGANTRLGWVSAWAVWVQLERDQTIDDVRRRLEEAYQMGLLARADSRDGWLWRIRARAV